MDNRTLPSGVDSKAIYRRIGRLTWPIVLQNLLSAAVTSADVVMLNFVGQAHISAVSLAAQYASVLFMIFYGLGTGVTMLATQYYGKGDMRAVEVVEGIALRFSLGVAALFALGAAFFPTGMMRVFTHDAELVAIGAEYLRWISVAYLCWGVIEIYLATLRSVGRDTDKRASMGNVGGTLFVRASKAAADTYDAMRCRGFEGEYDGGARARLRAADAAWICSFILFLALFLHLEGIV